MESIMKKSKFLAILSYLNFLVLIPLFAGGRNGFVKKHMKQGLFLLLCLVLLPFVLIIPLLGWIIGGVWAAALLILWVIGIVSAATGHERSLPLIGKLTDRLVI
jgi:uncharacterized membrane protein